MTSQSNHDTINHQEHAHGHPVVSWQVQLGVLIALLFFTFTTVLFFNAENWIETAFQIHLPGWINIVGAMTIATVKAILVCMFFMGLLYDKAINTFAMLFCLFCVALFLGLTMIDLQTRDRIYDWKKGEVAVGGTGKALDTPSRDKRFDSTFAPNLSSQGLSIADFRRQQKIESKGSENAFWKYYYKKYTGQRHTADTNNYFAILGYDKNQNLPTANQAAPRSGITPGLFDAAEPTNPNNSHDAEPTETSDDGH